MITFTRRNALYLKTVFRRKPLGLPHRGPTPPLVFHAGPRGGLRVLHRQEHLAVECTLPAQARPREVVRLPLRVLVKVGGRDDSPVVIEETRRGTHLEWTDFVIPYSTVFDFPVSDPVPAPPRLPATWFDAPGSLLGAMAWASNWTSRLRVEGGDGGIVDDLRWHTELPPEFRFPWNTVMNLASSPVLGRIPPPRGAIRIGRTGTHFVIHAGLWKVWLRLHDAFEEVEEEGDDD